jgi:ribosomal protein S5
VIKALATVNGRRLLLLGIDDRAVERLTAGQPILVRGAEVGLGVRASTTRETVFDLLGSALLWALVAGVVALLLR